MKLEINVSYARNVNLANYESVRVQVGITEEIENTDNRSYEEVFKDLFDECEHFVLEKCEIKAKKSDEKEDDDIPF